MIFVTGGSASGKSEYAGRLAERLAAKNPGKGNILYIATLSDRSEESRRRVQRHRQLRRNGAYTVEECFSLEALKLLTDDVLNLEENDDAKKRICSRYSVILFDSLDGFTANILFGSGTDSLSPSDPAGLAEKTAGILLALTAASSDLIVVSDAIYSDGVLYDEMTRRYMEYTACTEQLLVDKSDCVVEVVCGIPVLWKGEHNESL